METENGYYYNNQKYVLSLRYSEKSTDADIFLCAKPECPHDGSKSCTATYDFLFTSNYIFYDGSIYFVAYEHDSEAAGYALYRASPDGSALDKVCDVRKLKYTEKDEYYIPFDFIIHKGYAYIPYRIGESYKSFETGLAKTDIKTGETEILFMSDDFFQNQTGNTEVYAGFGDYVYYYTNIDKKGFSRYNVTDGSNEKINDSVTRIAGYSENTIYFNGVDENNLLTLKGYDIKTLEPNGNEIKCGIKNINAYTFIYDEKAFAVGFDSVKIFSLDGELLSETKCRKSNIVESEDDLKNVVSYWDERMFGISDGKLYIRYPNKNDTEACVYYCTIDGMLLGNGKWEEAYTVKNYKNYWNEEPELTKMNRE